MGDGCTWAPDSIGGMNLLPCCDKHDEEYELGGTAEDRKVADCALRDCIASCGKNWFQRFIARRAAQVYYLGVRIGGSRHWPAKLSPMPGRKRWGHPYPGMAYGVREVQE